MLGLSALSLSPDVFRWALELLMCWNRRRMHSSTREGTMAGNEVVTGSAAACTRCFVYTCTTLSSTLEQLTGPRPGVKNRYPDLACGYLTAPCTHALHPHSLRRLLFAAPVLPLESHQYRKSRAFASCTTH